MLNEEIDFVELEFIKLQNVKIKDLKFTERDFINPLKNLIILDLFS